MKTYKGCCRTCAWWKGKMRGSGADRVPWKVKRQLGMKRRIKR